MAVGAKGWGTQGNNDAGEKDPQPQAGNRRGGCQGLAHSPAAPGALPKPQLWGRGRATTASQPQAAILASLGLEGS